MPDFPISGPIGIIAMLLLGGLGLPFPEELVLSAGGVAAHPDVGALYLVILSGWFGVMAGDSLIYALGRFFGGNVIRHPLIERD